MNKEKKKRGMIHFKSSDLGEIILKKDNKKGRYLKESEVNKNMTERKQIYKCEMCGNIVEVLHAGVGELVCCGEPMELMEEKTQDSSTEKHVPFIEKKDNGFLVRIGENAAHPMEEKHFIEWIELIVDGVSHRKFLSPGSAPEAFFELSGSSVSAREYCNVHGLWKS